jgi:hypothetical protein
VKTALLAIAIAAAAAVSASCTRPLASVKTTPTVVDLTSLSELLGAQPVDSWKHYINPAWAWDDEVCFVGPEFESCVTVDALKRFVFSKRSANY